MTNNSQPIRDFFKAQRQIKARHRDIANALKISEATLLAAHAQTEIADKTSPLQVTALQQNWPAILDDCGALGQVMALTRNASCVHETIGTYNPLKNSSVTNGIDKIVGANIDLQIFYQNWSYGFGVEEQTAQGTQRSLQFFDYLGNAIHKIFLNEQSKVAAFTQIVEKHAQPPSDISIFSQCHLGLKTSSITTATTQHLTWTQSQLATKLDNEDCLSLLNLAAQQAVEITLNVRNIGMQQSYQGVINKVVQMGPWINVLDPTFNLHLKEDDVASTWLVQQTTANGCSQSVQLFDAQLQPILEIYGVQSDANIDTCAWRNVLKQLGLGDTKCLS